jgi:outer membrane protein assembly factor BamA
MRRSAPAGPGRTFAKVLLFSFMAAAGPDPCVARAGAPAPGDATGGRLPARAGLFERLAGAGSSRSIAADGSEGGIEETCRNLGPYYGCSIDTIVVTGNTRTKSAAILREMATKPGSRLDEKLIRRDAAFLRGLGYFAEVDLDAEQSAPGVCRLIVSVVDRPGLFMRFPYPVVNYDFEKGLSYGFTWKVKNFRGNAENLSLSAIRRQEKEQGAGFSWSNPWFAGRRVRLGVDAGAYRRMEEPGDANEEYVRERVFTGVGVGIPLSRNLVRQIWFKPSVAFEARDSRRMLSDGDGGIGTAYIRQNFLSTGGEIEYDSRSDRISPFDGSVARLRIRRLSSVHGLEESYIFYGASGYFYLPVGAERSFIVAVRSDVREGDLPTYYDMRLGGVSDVRGYSNDGERGRVKLVGTLQYRARFLGQRILRIPKIGEFDIAFNWTAFVDTGTLTNSLLDIDTSVFHSTAGLGIEIISPLRDIMRLEIASDGTGQPAFYLTAGTDF